MHLDRKRDRLGAWLSGLESRMHCNKVTVALAAKVARIAWVILTHPGALYERRDPSPHKALDQTARLEDVMTRQLIGAP